MGSIIGKQYKNLSNGGVIKVLAIDGNIAILENAERISIERLMNKSFYTSFDITPTNNNTRNISESNTFDSGVNANIMDMSGSGGLHDSLKSQIMGIRTDSINDYPDAGTSVSIIDPVESHSHAQESMVNSGTQTYSQSDKDALIERSIQNQRQLDSKMRKQTNQISSKMKDDELLKDVNIPRAIESDRDMNVSITEPVGTSDGNMYRNAPNQVQQAVVNPMFTKMKRIKKVTLKIDIEELMPSKELLKMLEEGFEDSVLDYLTDEIATKVLTDDVIKSQIRKGITDYVYGKSRVVKKKAPVKKVLKKKAPVKKTNKTT